MTGWARATLSPDGVYSRDLNAATIDVSDDLSFNEKAGKDKPAVGAPRACMNRPVGEWESSKRGNQSDSGKIVDHGRTDRPDSWCVA